MLDLGLCGTEEMYFATTHFAADGGIEVTASHNPIDYNGMKLVGRGSAPLDAATGLAAIRRARRGGRPRGSRHPRQPPARRGRARRLCERVLSFVDVAAIRRPLRILVNAGNGAAGPTFDAIADALAARGAPIEFVRMHHDPDGGFPNGIPNPLLPENQPQTGAAVVRERCAVRRRLGRRLRPLLLLRRGRHLRPRRVRGRAPCRGLPRPLARRGDRA